MKQIIIAIGVGGLLLVAAYLFAGENNSYWGMHDNTDTYSAMGNSNMMMGQENTIDNEKKFIELMVPHHEEAIQTAQEVLERGGTTEGMIALADNIISSQTREVEFMKTSYEEWYGTPYEATGEYQPMMRELAEYEGKTLDLVFLHDMTMHHMGAIRMARSLQGYTEHESMEELTTDIVVNQTREIQTMQELYQAIQKN